MSRSHISMRKVREILRLRFDLKHSYQKIAASVGISSSTASDTCARAKPFSLSWPLPSELTDGELESQLYPSAASKNKGLADNTETTDGKSIDFAYIHKELKRKSVTLTLLKIIFPKSEIYQVKHQNPYNTNLLILILLFPLNERHGDILCS